MARRDHDARDGAEPAHRIGEHGNGVHVRKEVCDDAVGGENARRGFGEHVRLAAGIVRDDHAALHRGGAERLDVFGKPLRRPAHGEHVHHVRAVADDAAHARGAELELRAETVFDLLFVAFDRLQLALAFLAERGIVQPFVIHCFVIHFFLPPTCRFLYFMICMSAAEAEAARKAAVILWRKLLFSPRRLPRRRVTLRRNRRNNCRSSFPLWDG